jgi:hypothetical protein
MKINLFLLLAFVNLLVACQKQEDDISLPKETKALIDENTFVPSKSLVIKSGTRYFITFIYDKQKIEIITNDTISGIYTISSDNLKSSNLLRAILSYSDENTKLIGTTGEIEIIKDNSGAIAGTYNATVSNNENSYTIDDGSFTIIQPNTESPLIEHESAILDTLNACYSKFYTYVEFTYIFDGVYSNSISSPDASWAEVYEHKQTQSSENQKIFNLWNDAYSLIYEINLIIKSSELMLSESNTKSLIIAQLKAMRAYLFYNLMTWFGEIPIEKEFYFDMNPRESIPRVISQIADDATEAMDSLPVSWSGGDNFRIPKNAMLGILARVYLTDFSQQTTYPTPEPYLYGSNYSESISISRQIINCGLYILKNISNDFTASDQEIIWGFDKGNNSEFNQIFNKGSYIPLIRLTEIYLILTEALLYNNDSEGALTLINQLNSSRSNPIVSSITPEDIYLIWDLEMDIEGSIYLVKKRFNKAMDLLQNDANKILLPLPLSALIENPNLIQNVGY